MRDKCYLCKKINQCTLAHRDEMARKTPELQKYPDCWKYNEWLDW